MLIDDQRVPRNHRRPRGKEFLLANMLTLGALTGDPVIRIQQHDESFVLLSMSQALSNSFKVCLPFPVFISVVDEFDTPRQ